MVVAVVYERAIQVQCYSGQSYAERPASFIYQDTLYEIGDIKKDWLEPKEKHFIVLASSKTGEVGKKQFELLYDERKDTWFLCEL